MNNRLGYGAAPKAATATTVVELVETTRVRRLSGSEQRNSRPERSEGNPKN
jgi:hypothetical protein